jgi:outer membrane protein assembly factor BamB
MCFNKNNGELLWTSPATGIPGEPAEPPETSEDTGLAAPSTATDGNLVCAIFGTGNLVCLDMEGTRVWAKNLGLPENHYGHSSSLIIHNGLLLVQYDHFTKKSLIALDLNTGNQVWETIRQVDISWASPVIAEFNGIEQVILTSAPSVKSYDIETGRELWSADCMSGEVGPSVATNSRYVFAVNDFATLSAIDPLNNGEVIWQDNEYTPEVASPVATEDLVFVLTTWGGVAAYDVATGDMVWDHEFDYGFYASPVIAGGMIYMLDQAGVMHIVKASREFDLVAVSPLGERANTTPAFSEGKIYLRTDDNLYCITM